MSLENISLTIGAKVPTAIYTSSAEPVCIVDTMGERKDDADRPKEICDRNGEVVLAMCKLCSKAEAELETAQEGEVMRYQMRDVACGLVKIVDTKRNRCLQKPHGDEFFTRAEAREHIDRKNAIHRLRLAVAAHQPAKEQSK